MTDFASAPQIKLISKHDGVLLIEVSGSLTALDHRLIDTIAGYLEAGHRNFVLRMSGVTNIDSAGLGQLISVYKLINDGHGTMRVLSPSQRVRERLRTTRLDTVFEILDDEAAA